MTYTIGSLFSGYGGLDLGVEAALGPARIAWVSDVCKVDKDGNVGHYTPHRGPCRVLAHRYPDAPNLGDITSVDWSTVEPVDVLTGGSPCQDLSNAGKRGGMTEGTRSNLWVAMREAIAQLRPKLVVWENVRGAYSAAADSALELDSRLLDQVRRRRGEPVLRALGRVVGDLSDLGYVGGWYGVRASDVGAAHQRFRVFVVAYSTGDEGRVEHGDGRPVADADESGLEFVRRVYAERRDVDGRDGAHRHGATRQPATLLPTSVTDPASANGHARNLGREAKLLSTPQARDWKGEPSAAHENGGITRDVRLLGTPTARDHKGSGQGDRLAESARRGQVEGQVRLLPTTRATDGTKGGPNQRGSSGDLMLPSAVHQLDDGDALLPTPNPFHSGNTESPDEWLLRRAEVQERTGTRHGPALSVVAWSIQEGLPLVQAGEGPQRVEPGSDKWGPYAAAVHRAELAFGRPAPDPTEVGPKGNTRLSARFDEWHMGLPDGWVTDVPDITWHEVVKLCGNGVVPRQSAAAVATLLHHFTSQ